MRVVIWNTCEGILRGVGKGLMVSKLCGTACPEQSTIKIAVDFIIIVMNDVMWV